MAKMQIKITKTETGFLKTPETIVEIDVNCGNWKYWDDRMEGNEKISLTMNNIFKAHYLAYPVKDAYGYHDTEKWEQDREIVIKDATVRTYESLHEYLCHRINNVKESCLKSHTFTATLFDETNKRWDEDTVTENINYELDGMITVEITKEDGI